MRQRGDVFDGLNFEAGRLERGDRAFATTTWAFYFDFDFLDAVLLRLIGRLLRGHLASERRALAAPFEATRASAGPAKRVALGIGDRNRCVVKRRLDVSDADRHVAACFFL